MLLPRQVDMQGAISSTEPMQLLNQKGRVTFGIKVPAIGELPAGDQNASRNLTKRQAKMGFQQPQPGKVGTAGHGDAQPDTGKGIRRKKLFFFWRFTCHLPTPSREQARRHNV